MLYAPCTMRFGVTALVNDFRQWKRLNAALFIINFQDFDKGLKNMRKREKRQAGFFNPENESDNSNYSCTP